MYFDSRLCALHVHSIETVDRLVINVGCLLMYGMQESASQVWFG